jgi:heme/copper-type cytochrome/quinol oxidase subunit 1
LILASCVIDTLLHDSYFVIGHFHYVLSLGALYSYLGGFYNYCNFFSMNNLYSNLYSLLAFIYLFFTSNIIFLPMHYLGLLSIPRRIYDYRIFTTPYFTLSSLGIGTSLSFIVLFLCSLIYFSYSLSRFLILLFMILLGLRYLASSLPLFSFVGVGIGVGIIFGHLLLGISRNPSISNSLIR